MSWGKGIVIVFILFVGGIGVMVYKSMSKNVDLVATNYYENELKVPGSDQQNKQLQFTERAIEAGNN